MDISCNMPNILLYNKFSFLYKSDLWALLIKYNYFRIGNYRGTKNSIYAFMYTLDSCKMCKTICKICKAIYLKLYRFWKVCKNFNTFLKLHDCVLYTFYHNVLCLLKKNRSVRKKFFFIHFYVFL